jgi:hypothetical protein
VRGAISTFRMKVSCAVGGEDRSITCWSSVRSSHESLKGKTRQRAMHYRTPTAMRRPPVRLFHTSGPSAWSTMRGSEIPRRASVVSVPARLRSR